MTPLPLPPSSRIQFEQRLKSLEESHGKTIEAIALSLSTEDLDVPDIWTKLCDYVVVKFSLGLALSNNELLVLAARGFRIQQQSGGLESYIESEECDLWKILRMFLSLTDADGMRHFDQLMTLTGEEFSQDRMQRISQLYKYLDTQPCEVLDHLEASYKEFPYPVTASILRYLMAGGENEKTTTGEIQLSNPSEPAMDANDAVGVLTDFLALSVIADDRWPDESDDVGLSILGFLLFGFAHKTCADLRLPLTKATEIVTLVLAKHTECTEDWLTSFRRELEDCGNEKDLTEGLQELIGKGATYQVSEDMSQVVDRVYEVIHSHRMQTDPLGETANGQTREDFQVSESLVSEGAAEFVEFCISRGSCEFDQELVSKFREIVSKHPITESDNEEIDPEDQFAFVVRNGLIKAGLIAPGDAERFQAKLSMAFVSFID
jgi:hypothetical protein